MEVRQVSDLPEVMTAKQLAAFLHISEASLAQDRYLRRGVPFVKVGNKRVRYMREDVLNYLAANRSGGAA
nr:helix-turn-helix domain-containing protein [Mycobacterium talmoniae]